MYGSLKLVVFVVCLAASPSLAQANSAMTIAGRTSQPIGHHEFCQRLPQECSAHQTSVQRVRLNGASWRALVQINQQVNKNIKPATDFELWGADERWSYPSSRGDCEDFVLLKRKMLINMGFPASALLITVVRRQDGDGHAVLTVRTDRGDFVLDNLVPQILAWNATDYQYLKRQSQFHSAHWMRIRDNRQRPAQLAAYQMSQ